MTTPRPRRSASFAPVALVLVLVALALALSALGRARHGYRQGGRRAYATQARELARGACEEAGLRVQELLDGRDHGPPSELKRSLLAALAAGPRPEDVLLELDEARALAPETTSWAAELEDLELREVRVRLHGFHPLRYAETDVFEDPRSYYANPGAFDEARPAAPRDWLGYATIQARVAAGPVTRRVELTHDVKVVDVAPPGREFAWFSWLPVTPAQRQVGLDLVSLNAGGTLGVHPRSAGRIMTRGPYRVLLEGSSDGTGSLYRSTRMEPNHSYPEVSDRWDGWSSIPGHRALLPDLLAWPWGRATRPEGYGARLIPYVRIPTIDFFTVLTVEHTSDTPSQDYFTAAVAEGEQRLRIWGDPARRGLDLFPGEVVRYGEAGRGVSVGSSAGGGALPAGEDGDSIEPEGLGLWGVYKLASFRNDLVKGPCLFYNGSFGVDSYMIMGAPTPGCLGASLQDLQAPDSDLPRRGAPGFFESPLGLRWWSGEDTGLGSYAPVVPVGTAEQAAPGAAVKNGGTLLDQVALGEFVEVQAPGLLARDGMGARPGAGARAEATPWAADLARRAPEGALPSGYRPLLRAATRVHPTFSEALGRGGETLELDGVVGVEQLGADVSARYRGRGALVSTVSGGEARPSLGDLEAEDDGRDWLTIEYLAERAPPPGGGGAQLGIDGEVRATVVAQEGVTSAGYGHVVGNLITAAPNMHATEPDAGVDVTYARGWLAPPERGGPPEHVWTDGTWTRVTISPKASGYHESP